jgi:hypothetical protein
LRWVNQLVDHHCLFWHVVSHPPEELVLEDEGQLCASWVHVNLVNQVICHSTVFYHRNPKSYQCQRHGRQHNGVGLVKRILLDKIYQRNDWYYELQVQLYHSPALWTVVV